jgi:hypothetical protein
LPFTVNFSSKFCLQLEKLKQVKALLLAGGWPLSSLTTCMRISTGGPPLHGGQVEEEVRRKAKEGGTSDNVRAAREEHHGRLGKPPGLRPGGWQRKKIS